jgi:hypothetical protein
MRPEKRDKWQGKKAATGEKKLRGLSKSTLTLLLSVNDRFQGHYGTGTLDVSPPAITPLVL